MYIIKEMITGVQFSMINTKTGIVHGMDHPSTSLCGMHTGFTNKNISLKKTYKKITCMRCLHNINESFKRWSWQFDYESNIDSFDEKIHSPQLAAEHIFYDIWGFNYLYASNRILISS